MIGLSLAQYRIDAELGRGGMGIVYRATDTKLDRTVALKVLPASALSSEDDRARFYREAKAAAQLHHPNIASVFQIDEAIPVDESGMQVGATDGPRPFIAMEFVEGETVADRLRKAPLKLSEAVSIATMVAEALKAAHAKEIVHRDIKSANVMLTSDGVAKVLDFGLAKTNASTQLTRQGSTLGTVAYMSPEQARGQEVDGRSDLYSLGTMLYEMVAGRLPFAGDYEQAILYGILNEDPEPLTAVRTGVPMGLEWTVNKLLSKDADYRYQTAADLVADLKSLDVTGSGASRRGMAAASMITTRRGTAASSNAAKGRGAHITPGFLKAPLPLWAWGVIAVAFVLGAAASWLLRTLPEPPPRPVRTLDLHVEGSPAAVSPDGRLVVLSARADGSAAFDLEAGKLISDLDVRRTWRYEFSPDGRWLLNSGGPGDGGLFRLRMDDNRSVPIRDEGMGGTWLTDNVILYTSDKDSSLWSVGIDGEAPTLRVAKDYDRDHIGLYFPFVLPGGRYALAHGWSGEDRDVVLADLEAGTYEILIPNAACARYLPSGHVLYVDGGQTTGELMLRPFDPERRQFTGDETPAGMGEQSCWTYAVGADGTAVYGNRTPIDARTWYWLGVDGTGLEPIAGPPRGSDESVIPVNLERIALSPKGDLLASTVREAEGVDIYLYDLAQGTSRRFTFSQKAYQPTWSPDGRWIYYADLSDSVSTIMRKPSDMSGAAESTGLVDFVWPDVSDDGSRLIVSGFYAEPMELYTLGDTTGIQIPDTWNDRTGTLSPDGRYVATDGEDGIMVREAGGSTVIQVAPGLPDQGRPKWAPDGRYLYFQSRFALYRVRISTESVFNYGEPELVADGLGPQARYDPHPDGKRVLVFGQPPGREVDIPPLRLILNWRTLVREIAPVGSD